MRIVARAVSQGSILPETTVNFRSGAVTLVPIESGQRPSVLGLILSGRMAPHSGDVTIDGGHDARLLRTVTALVDAPDVSAPEDDLTLGAVLREEIAFSGARRGGTARAVSRMIADEGLVAYRSTRMAELPTDIRVRALAGAAAERKRVAAVVIVTPDRHGGDPRAWYEVVRGLAGRGLAVAVLAGFAAADAIAASFPDVVRDAEGALVEEILVPDEHIESALAEENTVSGEQVAAETALLPVQEGGAEDAVVDEGVPADPAAQDASAVTTAMEVAGVDADDHEHAEDEQEHRLLRRDLRTQREEETEE